MVERLSPTRHWSVLRDMDTRRCSLRRHRTLWLVALPAPLGWIAPLPRFVSKLLQATSFQMAGRLSERLHAWPPRGLSIQAIDTTTPMGKLVFQAFLYLVHGPIFRFRV